MGILDTPGYSIPAAKAAFAPKRPQRFAKQVRPTVVLNMASGHGFGIYGHDTTLTNLNDTTDFLVGSQASTMVTKGDNTFAALFSGVRTAVDMTGKSFVVWVKVDNPNAVSNVSFWAGSDAASLTTNIYKWQLSGTSSFTDSQGWQAITLQWSDAQVIGSPNRAAITRYQISAQDTNAGLKAVVRFNGAASLPEPAADYPNGVVSFTFDDSAPGQATIARRILSREGYQATMYPVADRLQYVSLAEMRALQDDLGWEFGLHASTWANHGIGWRTMTEAATRADLDANYQWLVSNGFRVPESAAYPLGQYDAKSVKVLRDYVAGCRSTDPFPLETVMATNPYRLRSVTNVGGTGGTSVATLTTATTGQLDRTVASKGWLILTIHDLIETGSGGFLINAADFQTLVTAVKTRGMAVRTVADVLAGRV